MNGALGTTKIQIASCGFEEFRIGTWYNIYRFTKQISGTRAPKRQYVNSFWIWAKSGPHPTDSHRFPLLLIGWTKVSSSNLDIVVMSDYTHEKIIDIPSNKFTVPSRCRSDCITGAVGFGYCVYRLVARRWSRPKSIWQQGNGDFPYRQK